MSRPVTTCSKLSLVSSIVAMGGLLRRKVGRPFQHHRNGLRDDLRGTQGKGSPCSSPHFTVGFQYIRGEITAPGGKTARETRRFRPSNAARPKHRRDRRRALAPSACPRHPPPRTTAPNAP